MLDLDSMVERRAKSLNQDDEPWRKAVWSPEFQRISQSMSDGEVEELISICPSVAHLESVTRFLFSQLEKSGVPPYTLLMAEAARAGLEPAEWVEKSHAADR